LAATVAQGVTAGTVHLTGLVPMDWIAPVTAWMGFAVFVWMAIQTSLNGLAGPGVGPLASPPSMDEIHKMAAEAAARH
jgi:hypothetical protein